MSASHIIVRLLILFFFLAGILLLRKPDFGQVNHPTTQRIDNRNHYPAV